MLDLNKLKTKYKAYTYDWNAVVKRHYNYSKNPSKFESETRVSRSPKTVRDENEPETVISPKFIQAIILKSSVSASDKEYILSEYKDTKVILIRKSPDKYKLIKDRVDFVNLVDAVAENDIVLVAELLKRGSDPNGLPGQSALHYAVQYSTYEMVKLLLDNGADINNKGIAWDIPMLETAVKRVIRRPDTAPILRILVEHGVDYGLILENAAEKNDVEKVEVLLESLRGYPIDMANLVHAATIFGETDVLKFLLDDYNVGYTKMVLDNAAGNGYVDVARLVLRYWDIPQVALNNALIRANAQGHKDTVDLLLYYEADPSVIKSKEYAAA